MKLNIKKFELGINKISKYLFVTLFILILIVIATMIINNKAKDPNQKLKDEIEGFRNELRNQDLEYLKFKETHLSLDDQNYDKLYEKYSGAGKGSKQWKKMTLNQCIDRCNKIDNCIAFNRENIGDNEKGVCQPIQLESKCYSSRKGDFDQRQEALDMNLYYKKVSDSDKMNEIINKCIGDLELTLDRNILIKSYAFPTKHIGCKDNRVRLIGDDSSKFLKLTACKFKVEAGLEGSGTLSFKHLHFNKYLYRDSNNNLITHKIDKNSTEEKLRSSFHLYDGLSNQVMLICCKLRGEKNSNKVITCTPNGKQLKIIRLDELKNKELATFDIVDLITNITVVNKRDQLSSPHKSQPKDFVSSNNVGRNNISETKNTAETNNNSETKITLENKNRYNIKSNISDTIFHNSNSEGFANLNDINNENFNDIDRMELYQYVESGLKRNDFIKEYQENTNNNQINLGKFKTLSSIDAAFDKILDLPTNNDYGENMFMQTIKFNKHLYDADNGLRDKLKDNKSRIQKCIDNLNKMMIQDMAKDYNFLNKK